jgi:hypothetical protein
VIYGAGIDTAIGKLLVEAVSPLALEVALAVQQEIQTRVEEADRLRRTQVERARYEAQLAQRRYLQVDSGQPLGGGARWRPTGTASCARWPTLNSSMSSNAKPTPPRSIRDSASASWP